MGRGVAGDSHYIYIYIYASIATRPGAPDGEQLWDTELRRIDALLEDEAYNRFLDYRNP